VYDDLNTNTDKAPQQKMFFLSGSNGWSTDKAPYVHKTFENKFVKIANQNTASSKYFVVIERI
jgi:hypothetical protein